jgi:hypothetical protein
MTERGCRKFIISSIVHLLRLQVETLYHEHVCISTPKVYCSTSDHSISASNSSGFLQRLLYTLIKDEFDFAKLQGLSPSAVSSGRAFPLRNRIGRTLRALKGSSKYGPSGQDAFLVPSGPVQKDRFLSEKRLGTVFHMIEACGTPSSTFRPTSLEYILVM